MPLFIHGIGTASPPFSISQEHAARMAERFGCRDAEQQRQLKTLYRLTRVRQRQSVVLESDGLEEEPRQSFFPDMRDATDRGPTTSARMARYEADAPVLATAAGRAALADARIEPEIITHVVTVSCTGFAAPGFDLALVRELGLRRDVERTHIGFMGCHAALNGLRVARAYADATPDACVIVCAVELCTLHYQYGWDPAQMVANALFGDGAAALIGRAQPPAMPKAGTEAGAQDCWALAANGATLLEDSAELMTWRVGDRGFGMTLSARVPGVIQQRLRPWLDGWLASHDVALDHVATWALHPGGPRILEACGQVLGLSREAYAVSQEVLAAHGNMSSPTMLFILDVLRRRNAPRPCVALGFGPGLAVEAALFL
ncbi:MAG: type III polyketide synthase [Acidobacteriota bacterium]